MTPAFVTRLLDRPAMRALRQSLRHSEQDAVAYIAQLHQTGPGLYTAPRNQGGQASRKVRRVLPARWTAAAGDYDIHGVAPVTGSDRS